MRAADAVRDALDVPWEGLTEVERQRVSGLSEDLYAISDPDDAARLAMNATAHSVLAGASAAADAGEWDRALELLRGRNQDVPPAALSQARGRIWLDAGDPATAALFLEHADSLPSKEILAGGRE